MTVDQADPEPVASDAMRLAVVCESLESHAASGRQALALAHALATMGQAVTLICAVDRGEQSPPGVSCKSMGAYRLRSPARLVGYRRWAARQLATLRPDASVSLTTLVPADVLYPVGGTIRAYRQFLRGLQAPLPMRARLWAKAFTPALWVRDAIEQRTLSSKQAYSAVADNAVIAKQLDPLVEALPGGVHRVEAALTAEPTGWKQAADLRDRLVRAFDLPEHATVFAAPFNDAFAGGFAPMMLGFKALIDRGQEAVLLLAGPMRYTHLAWVAQLGVRPNVRVLGRCDEPAQLIAASDVVVVPARHDPAGTHGLAALSHGKPLITTRASGAATLLEAMDDPAAGVLLDSPPQADALADAMQRFCDPEHRPITPPKTLDGLRTPAGRAEQWLSLLREAAGRA